MIKTVQFTIYFFLSIFFILFIFSTPAFALVPPQCSANCIDSYVGNTGTCDGTFGTNGTSWCSSNYPGTACRQCGSGEPAPYFACYYPCPTPTPCPGVSVCFLGACFLSPGTCGTSTCSGIADCASAPTPTPTPTTAPFSCPAGYTLCPDNSCYSCPAGYNLSCGPPASCTSTVATPTPTPTLAAGGNCGAFGCNGPNLTVTWKRNSIWPAYNLQLVKRGTLTNACSGITNSCTDFATVGDRTSYTFTGLGTNGYYDLYVHITIDLNNLWDFSQYGPTGACTGGFCTPSTPTPTPTPVRLPTSTPIPTPVPTYSISGTVYIDNNGNGVQEVGEPAYNGATVTRTGSVSTTTNTSGFYSFSNLTSNTYMITLTVPVGYATPTNPKSATVGPNATVNFGIAPTYTISGNVFIDTNNNGIKDGTETNWTSSAITISSSPTGTVTAPCCTGAYTVSGVPNGSYTITLTAIPPGYIISNGGTSPNTNPRSIAVSGANVPNINFGIAPTYTISGNVFVDDGVGVGGIAKDGIKNGTETNYTLGASTVQVRSGSCTGTLIGSSSPANGAYSVSNIPAGTYAVCYTSLPGGYQVINPTTGPPPFFTKSVGPSVPNVDFAILLYGPWIQSACTDIRIDSGFDYYIPSTAALSCGGPYASIPCAGGTPGIIFTGDTTANFGQGSASTKNWVVGGSTPELFTPTKGNVIRTSYSYINAQIKQAGLTATTLPASCNNSSGCSLSTLTHGLYSNTNPTPQPIYINASNMTCTNAGSNGNCVFLINGDIHIQGNITVPVGATATFISSGNIYVDPSVGNASGDITTPTAQVQGYYSTDKSFIIQGTNNCSVGTDKRLNIAGSVIVNAARTSPAGTFQNLRDLCGGNATCPVFSIQERPDFILNAPDLIKYQNTIYREVAP